MLFQQLPDHWEIGLASDQLQIVYIDAEIQIQFGMVVAAGPRGNGFKPNLAVPIQWPMGPTR